MRALVTGAYGFVGPHMVRSLVEQGYEVFATDHPTARPKPLPPGVTFVPTDQTDYDATAKLIRDTRAQLECGLASIFRYDTPRDVILRVNSLIAENFLRATLRHNPSVERVIFWGSSSVYGDRFRLGAPLDENAPMLPRNAYEESKFLQHIICRQYFDKLPLTEILPMAIYGPGGNYGALVVIDMMAKNQLPGYPGGGKNRISLVHVTDVCRAALFLAGHPDSIGKWYNLGDASSYTIGDLMRYLRSELARLGIRVDLLPVSYPLWLMKIFAWRSDQLARKYGHAPIVQRDFLGYFEKGYDFLVDSSAIRSMGFKFLYDDPIRDLGLRETLEWQQREGLI